MASESEIDKIDQALERYYKWTDKGEEYKEDRVGKFKAFCEDNGIDIDDEMEVDPQDAMIVEFDEDFPFPPDTADDEDAKKQWIFNLIKEIRERPDMKFQKYFGTQCKYFSIHSVIFNIYMIMDR